MYNTYVRFIEITSLRQNQESYKVSSILFTTYTTTWTLSKSNAFVWENPPKQVLNVLIIFLNWSVKCKRENIKFDEK